MAAVESDQELGEDTFVWNDFHCFVSFTQAAKVGVDTNYDSIVGVVSRIVLVVVQNSGAKMLASVLPTFLAS